MSGEKVQVVPGMTGWRVDRQGRGQGICRLFVKKDKVSGQRFLIETIFYVDIFYTMLNIDSIGITGRVVLNIFKYLLCDKVDQT